MLKKEFKAFEKICKAEWTALSKNGKNHKSSFVYDFHCNCPACELNVQAERAYTGTRNVPCQFCPIDEWRKQAGKGLKDEDGYPLSSICENGKEAYNMWCNSRKKVTRMIYADRIAKMKWTFLPIYKKIELPEWLQKTLAKKMAKLAKMEK